MSNPLTDELYEHINECFNLDNITFKSQVSEDDFVIDTGNSFICKNCKKVILKYE